VQVYRKLGGIVAPSPPQGLSPRAWSLNWDHDIGARTAGELPTATERSECQPALEHCPTFQALSLPRP
jgi:hypothetical protein